MARAYSMDLRTRVLTDADAGLSSKELAERYHVSRAWVDALKQRRRETGSSAPRTQTKFRGRVLAGQESRLAGADRRAARCHVAGIARRPGDDGRSEHPVARDRSLGLHRQKKRYTPTNNVGLTSSRPGGSGARGSRSTTCGSTSSSMNAA
jgi:hypothetical protein